MPRFVIFWGTDFEKVTYPPELDDLICMRWDVMFEGALKTPATESCKWGDEGLCQACTDMGSENPHGCERT